MSTPPGPAVHAVVLAAGVSRRFGDAPPKQLATFHGEPLVRRVARVCLASRCRAVTVVLGHRHEEVAAALEGLGVEIVLNPAFSEGKAASIRSGLAALPASAAAALFVPCDQPLLDAVTINRLLAAFERAVDREESPTSPIIVAPIVVPTAIDSQGATRRGAPVLFARPFFSELLGLRGEAGGRSLLRRHPEAVVEVPLPTDLPLRDADTPERLHDLAGLSPATPSVLPGTIAISPH